jgi:glycosyltransferase involved in cell wall biosynthesis
MTKIRISIITPFYKGNAYMPSYWAMIRRNAETLQRSELQDRLEFEALLVNDSPEEKILLPESLTIKKSCDENTELDLKLQGSEGSSRAKAGFEVRLIQNPKNLGIQKSRIHGLQEAKGSYILFLDQDDILADDAILSFGRAVLNDQALSKPCLYVANAILEQKDWRSLWYRTDYHKRQVGNKSIYLHIGTMIISPGQCLLPRQWIPDFWINHPLALNGADDYFLWILLLEAGVAFRYLDQALYVHRYTSENLSGDTRKTDQSTFEFIEILQKELKPLKTDFYPIGKNLSLPVRQTLHDIHTLRAMMEFKADFRRGGKAEKLQQILSHPSLFLRNVSFKIRSKTGYGFNR